MQYKTKYGFATKRAGKSSPYKNAAIPYNRSESKRSFARDVEEAYLN